MEERPWPERKQGKPITARQLAAQLKPFETEPGSVRTRERRAKGYYLADIVRSHPGRIIAVYIREVRLDPGDGRVEAVSEGWADAEVPFVLAADSDAVRRHAESLRLL